LLWGVGQHRSPVETGVAGKNGGAWQSRRLDDLEVVYLWADGV